MFGKRSETTKNTLPKRSEMVEIMFGKRSETTKNTLPKRNLAKH